MAEFEPLHKPIRINPLIRASRYALLISGIFYGFTHSRSLARSTAAEQQEILKQIERRDANRKIMDKIKGEQQMQDLAKEAGVVPKQ